MSGSPARGPSSDPVRVVFFGSGAFAVPILDALLAAPDVEVVGVVTAPDRAAGRGGAVRATPVAERAADLGVEILKPERLRAPESVAVIRDLRPGLGVLADYGQIVPPDLLAVPALGILNVHPSLLPRHRGATPVQATILAGDEQAGVSIMAMDEGLDTGPIVASRAWALAGDERAPELESRAAAEGGRLLLEVLPAWVAGAARARPQDEGSATTTRILRRSDGRLDPARAAADLERRVRALTPWPGAYLDTEAGRLLVHEAHADDARPADEPPALVEHDDGLAIVTVAGRLVLDRVQPAGGRAMSGAEFARGHRGLLGSRLTGPTAGVGA